MKKRKLAQYYLLFTTIYRHIHQTKSCSILSFNSNICDFNVASAWKVIQAATTGLLIPQALPKLALLDTKQYGIFLYSHKLGIVIII